MSIQEFLKANIGRNEGMRKYSKLNIMHDFFNFIDKNIADIQEQRTAVSCSYEYKGHVLLHVFNSITGHEFRVGDNQNEVDRELGRTIEKYLHKKFYEHNHADEIKKHEEYINESYLFLEEFLKTIDNKKLKFKKP